MAQYLDGPGLPVRGCVMETIKAWPAEAIGIQIDPEDGGFDLVSVMAVDDSNDNLFFNVSVPKNTLPLRGKLTLTLSIERNDDA